MGKAVTNEVENEYQVPGFRVRGGVNTGLVVAGVLLNGKILLSVQPSISLPAWKVRRPPENSWFLIVTIGMCGVC